MSVTSASRGGRYVMGRRTPLTEAECLRRADVDMYRLRVEKHTLREIGRMFRCSDELVRHRLACVPASVKARVREDVKRLHRLRIADFREEMAPHAP